MPTIQEFKEALVEAVKAHPGVSQSALMSYLPDEFVLFSLSSALEDLIKERVLIGIKYYYTGHRQHLVLIPSDMSVQIMTAEQYC